MRSRQARRALVAVAAAATMVATTSPASGATSTDTTQFSVTPGSLAFTTAPDVPNLPALTLNGQAQTLNATMNSFGVDDATGGGAGWNVTVSGDNTGGKSAVFKRYCTQAGGCTGDPFGYVAGGATLAANTITLNSTSASFSAQGGTTGTAPTHQCNAGCFVDAAPASPVKVVSAAASAGMGTYATTGWTATSVAAATPSTVTALPANEVYRVDLLWTLGSGP
jgi:putative surface cell wall-binding protein